MITEKPCQYTETIMATVILPTWYKNKTTGLDILLSVESIQSLSVGEGVQDTYYTPKITCTPSIVDQIIYLPLTILDPYILSLQHNN